MTNVQFILNPSSELRGNITIPGDKSISHRAIILSAIAEGTSTVAGFLQGEDSLATLNAFRQLGVTISEPDEGHVTIHGVGLQGLRPPQNALNLGNSGTSMRLMCGLLSGQAFDSELQGDRSLSTRPMKRVITPLTLMKAHIESNAEGTAPLKIKKVDQLTGIHYSMPIASAQVKSCLLLAGLYAEGKTTLIEPAVTRDHTERMLARFGYPTEKQHSQISISGGGGHLTATHIQVPADISSATFFMVGACIARQADVVLQKIGINPTRTGILHILSQMGAHISLHNETLVGAEPVADIHIKSSQLRGINVPLEWVPLAIDEFPAIFIAAACAKGRTVITGARELRVKESDRIQVMCDGLLELGIDATATEDGMIIEGGKITGGHVFSGGDHRIAMAFAMASLAASEEIIINDCLNVNTSFPGFVHLAQNCGVNITSKPHE